MRRTHKRFKPHAEINITPLVDVMLVLLIIFMVTAPMMTVGVPVDLPKTQGTASADTKDPIVISLDAQGKIFLQDNEISLVNLVTKLQEKHKNDERIFIRGDKSLSYGIVMEIMGTLSNAGFSHVSLMGEMR